LSTCFFHRTCPPQVIIDFMTSWCHGCQEIAPVYAEYAKKYPAAVFLKVNTEELEVSERSVPKNPHT